VPIEVVAINDLQRDKILALQEGHFLDLKAKDIKPSKLSKAISAFANADGGELYVGITDDRKWAGFANPEAANGHLQLLDRLFPLGDDYNYTFLSNPNQLGLVLQLVVKKSRAIVKAHDDVPYLRRGAQSLPVDSPEAFKILERNKGITSFENDLVNCNEDEIANSTTVIRFMLEIIPTSEPEPWLRKQQLVRGGKPTAAGILLFSDLPQAILPKRSGVKIYRYKTTLAEGTARDTCRHSSFSRRMRIRSSQGGCAEDPGAHQ
jgi:ATP-dependent DNA helicase RecG